MLEMVLKPMNDFTIYDLAARVKERAAAAPDVSYTRKLLDRGVSQCAKKFGEEAIETVIAAVAEDDERLVSEAADLIYHLLVVLEARGVSLAQVEAALARRSGMSGIAEKDARPRE
jgi:phosphoribosyl-ATP pyrophosphohydrolase